MTTWALEPLSSSALAFVSTIHVALAVLRKHRSSPKTSVSLLVVTPFLFVASPWLLPSLAGIAAGLFVHAGWFSACERLLPKAAARPEPARPAAAPVARAAPRPEPARASAAPSSSPAPAALPSGFHPAPVLAVFDETPDIRTFRMARPEGFDFKAGQFLSVRIQVDGKPLVRCYTISSSPEASGYLEISVKRQGLVSSTLHSVVRPGTLLSVKGPAGPFVYPQGDDRPLVLLGGGVGVTPLISMLRHAAAADPTRPTALLLSVRTEADIPFREELNLIGRRHPQARIVVTVTQGTASPEFYPGRIDERLVRQVVEDPEQAIYCLCGPLPMIASMKELLKRMGVPDGQVRSEAFDKAVAATKESAPETSISSGVRPSGALGAVPSDARGVSPPVAHAVPRSAGAAPAIRAQAEVRRTPQGQTDFTLELTLCGRRATVTPQQTLLEAAEAIGVEIPSSCRAGVCGTCRTRVVQGDVDCSADSLDPAEREDGYVLPCVAFARSHCALEA